VRLLTGLLLLAWLLPFAGDVEAFFGLTGWFDRQAYVEAARLTNGPPKNITWSLLYLCGSNEGLLRAAYWAAIAVLVLFTLGVGTRWTGVLTWLVVASFTANPAFDDEVDPLLLMLTAYLALGYLLLGLRTRGLSWSERIFGRFDTLFARGLLWRPGVAMPQSVSANLSMRLIQVNLAIMVVTTGLHKLQVADWWSGVALWFSLYPALETSVDHIRELIPEASWYVGLLNIAVYATLAWQLLFPTFAWRGGLGRIVLLTGAVVAFIGSAWVYSMPLFGAALAIGCLAFLSEEDWAKAGRAWKWISAFVGARLEGKPARGRHGDASTTRPQRSGPGERSELKAAERLT
jgi:hypothetical protein